MLPCLSKGSLCEFSRLSRAPITNRFPISDCKIPSVISSQIGSSLTSVIASITKSCRARKQHQPPMPDRVPDYSFGTRNRSKSAAKRGRPWRMPSFHRIQEVASSVMGRLARRAISWASLPGRRKMSEVNSTDASFLATTE